MLSDNRQVALTHAYFAQNQAYFCVLSSHLSQRTNDQRIQRVIIILKKNTIILQFYVASMRNCWKAQLTMHCVLCFFACHITVIHIFFTNMTKITPNFSRLTHYIKTFNAAKYSIGVNINHSLFLFHIIIQKFSFSQVYCFKMVTVSMHLPNL